MSLILDALNKAQRERQEERQPVPQLSTVHYAPAAFEQSSPGSRMLPWLALGVIIAGALLFVILNAMTPAAEVPAPSHLVEEPRPSVIQGRVPNSASVAADSGQELASVAAVPASAQAMSQRRPAPTTAQVNDLYRTANNPVEPIPAKHSLAEQVPVKLRPTVRTNPGEPTAAVPQLSTIAPPEPGRSSSVEHSGRQDLAQAAQTEQQAAPIAGEPAPALDDRPDVPTVDELSWSTQQMLPSILYTVHHYEANPANRLVEINNSTFRTAGTIAEGLVLEEILSDGVILRFRSQRFKLPALNSWVNF